MRALELSRNQNSAIESSNELRQTDVDLTDLDHLDRALTHASTGNEGKRNYERLEFLGDSVLNFFVALLALYAGRRGRR